MADLVSFCLCAALLGDGSFVFVRDEEHQAPCWRAQRRLFDHGSQRCPFNSILVWHLKFHVSGIDSYGNTTRVFGPKTDEK